MKPISFEQWKARMLEKNPVFIVTEKAQRPARMDGACFYCQQKIGEAHKADCVLVRKKVSVRMIVEYEIDVPAHWDANSVHSHRNRGSWCSDNALNELEAIKERDGCLCHTVRFECLADASGPQLEE